MNSSYNKSFIHGHLNNFQYFKIPAFPYHSKVQTRTEIVKTQQQHQLAIRKQHNFYYKKKISIGNVFSN